MTCELTVYVLNLCLYKCSCTDSQPQKQISFITIYYFGYVFHITHQEQKSKIAPSSINEHGKKNLQPQNSSRKRVKISKADCSGWWHDEGAGTKVGGRNGSRIWTTGVFLHILQYLAGCLYKSNHVSKIINNIQRMKNIHCSRLLWLSNLIHIQWDCGWFVKYSVALPDFSQPWFSSHCLTYPMQQPGTVSWPYLGKLRAQKNQFWPQVGWSV